MQLVDGLRHQLEIEQSYFRQHLMQEDLVRLERLVALLPSHPDPAAFIAAGLKIGWTPDDRRTHELKPALELLLLAIHERHTAAPAAVLGALDARIAAHWRAFEALRMDRLVGCLSRVPRPRDGAGT